MSNSPDHTDFIVEYSQYILSHIPCSKEWAEDNAVGVLSAVMGRNRYILTNIGRLGLNVWQVFIGPSGIAFKTIPMNNYAIPILGKFEELTDKKVLMPQSSSFEGMTGYLKEYKQKEGIIIKDEFTSMFKEVKKDYLTDEMEFYTKLYDGTTYKRFTRKAGLEEVKDCYVSLLGATTPYIYTLINQQIFIQGFGNRILFDLWEDNINDEIDIKKKFYGKEEDMKYEDDIEYFALGLKEIAESKVHALFPYDKSEENLAVYYNKKHREAKDLYIKNSLDIRSNYIVRAGEMAYKLAGLKAMSRLWKRDDLKNAGEYYEYYGIGEDDANWAITKINRHLGSFEKMLLEWHRYSTIPRIPFSEERYKSLILESIQNSADKIMKRSEITATIHIAIKTVDETARTLKEEGKIRILSENEIRALPTEVLKRHDLKGWRGMPPVVYQIKTG